ncbi:MAG: glutamate ligase domain-containing protein, partial [Kiloniellales bacterium]
IKGRGERHVIATGGGRFLLIDDSYNANPASMRAAFDVLGRVKVLPPARRIAVLGDMRELGEGSQSFHADLAKPLIEQGVDQVFLCGPEMAALARALPARVLAAHAPDSAALAPQVADAVGPGDAVLVKGSLGSRMALVIEALKALDRVPPRAANGN